MTCAVWPLRDNATSAIGLGLTAMALLGSGPLVRFISEDTLMFRQW